MSYLALNAIGLLVAGIVAAVLILRTPRVMRPRPRSVLLTQVVLLLLTALFDNVIIGVGLVDYDPRTLTGIMIGVAPIEDFAYSIAAGLCIPALWQYLSTRTERS